MLNILCGKSGCGKDTLLNELKKDGFIPLISTTSRPMREGEQNGREYNFTTAEDFKTRIANNEFIEYRTYNTLVNGKPDIWYYGMPKQEFDKNTNYVVILDMGGIKEFLNLYPKEDIFVCYIDTDDALREERALKRGGFDKTEWDRRAADDAVKFAEPIIKELADARIVNNEYTVEQLKNLFYTVQGNYQFQKEMDRAAEEYQNEEMYEADRNAHEDERAMMEASGYPEPDGYDEGEYEDF